MPLLKPKHDRPVVAEAAGEAQAAGRAAGEVGAAKPVEGAAEKAAPAGAALSATAAPGGAAAARAAAPGGAASAAKAPASPAPAFEAGAARSSPSSTGFEASFSTPKAPSSIPPHAPPPHRHPRPAAVRAAEQASKPASGGSGQAASRSSRGAASAALPTRTRVVTLKDPTPPPTVEEIESMERKNYATGLLLVAAAGVTYYISVTRRDPLEEAREECVSNWSGTKRACTDRFYEPETEGALAQLVERAHSAGYRLRPVGSAMSPSGAGLSTLGMVSTAHLDAVLAVDEEAMTVTAQAGARVSDVSAALERRGLALETYASVREQTLAGYTQAGCHGTGARVGTADDAVVALSLATPAKGRLELRADDADPGLFRLARLGLGSLGVVQRVTLKVVPLEELEEKTVVETREEVYRRHGERLKRHKYLRYLWIPGQDAVVVVAADPVRRILSEKEREEAGSRAAKKAAEALQTIVAAKGRGKRAEGDQAAADDDLDRSVADGLVHERLEGTVAETVVQKAVGKGKGEQTKADDKDPEAAEPAAAEQGSPAPTAAAEAAAASDASASDAPAHPPRGNVLVRSLRAASAAPGALWHLAGSLRHRAASAPTAVASASAEPAPAAAPATPAGPPPDPLLTALPPALPTTAPEVTESLAALGREAVASPPKGASSAAITVLRHVLEEREAAVQARAAPPAATPSLTSPDGVERSPLAPEGALPSLAELRGALLDLAPLSPAWVARVNAAEVAAWRAASGTRVAPAPQVLAFDCGGEQWVDERAFPVKWWGVESDEDRARAAAEDRGGEGQGLEQRAAAGGADADADAEGSATPPASAAEILPEIAVLSKLEKGETVAADDEADGTQGGGAGAAASAAAGAGAPRPSPPSAPSSSDPDALAEHVSHMQAVSGLPGSPASPAPAAAPAASGPGALGSTPTYDDLDATLELLAATEKLRIPAPAPIEQRWSRGSASPLSPAAGPPGSTHTWIGIVMYAPPHEAGAAGAPEHADGGARPADKGAKRAEGGVGEGAGSGGKHEAAVTAAAAAAAAAAATPAAAPQPSPAGVADSSASSPSPTSAAGAPSASSAPTPVPHSSKLTPSPTRMRAEAAFRNYARVAAATLTERHDATPHWAKLEVPTADTERLWLRQKLQQRYPLGALRAARAELDPRNVLGSPELDKVIG